MAREMKDSGIEWIGEIPKEWKLTRMKTCILHRDSGAWGNEANGDEGDIICLRIADFDYSVFRLKDTEEELLTKRNYNASIIENLLLQKNDIIIEKSGGGEKTPVGRTVIFDKHYRAVYANFCDRLRCREIILPQFMQYIFVTFYANGYIWNYIKQTTGIQNLDLTTMLSAEKIALPSIAEQQKIIDFLNLCCAELNNVIKKTHASIEEYKKLKQAVITQAVTKGIRGDREMRNSGIEWIGEIPYEWEVSQVKYSLKWKSKKGQPQEEVLSLYRDYGVIPKDSRDDNHNVTSLDTSGYKVVDIGDFVINKMKAWQGSMAVSEYRGIISPAYHVCEFINDNLNKKYFHYLMRNKSYIPEYTRVSTCMRVGQWDLGFDDFKNIPFLLPSQGEQQEIVNYLDEKCSAIDDLIIKKEQYLSEIENYKKSLIYEYVTGKKEVPQEYQV